MKAIKPSTTFRASTPAEIANYIYNEILYTKDIWDFKEFKRDLLENLVEFGLFIPQVKNLDLNTNEYSNFMKKNNLVVFETNFNIKTFRDMSEALGFARLYIKSHQKVSPYHFFVSTHSRIYKISPESYFESEELADSVTVIVNNPEKHKQSKNFLLAGLLTFLEMLKTRKIDLILASEIYPDEKNILNKEDIEKLKMEVLIYSVFRKGLHQNLFTEVLHYTRGVKFRSDLHEETGRIKMRKVKISDKEWIIAAKKILDNYLELIEAFMKRDPIVAKLFNPLLACAKKIKASDLNVEESKKLIEDMYTSLVNIKEGIFWA